MSIFKKAKKEPAQPLYECRGIVVSAKEAQKPPSENYLIYKSKNILSASLD